ncbi:unnamed protein product [Brassica oleracea]|uniref:(rape) hypothetical protein n=1 Tax=Brassica napus TaxID=3708 RepID=A0A816RLN7_BRANA|nr:unnamed protein product [Brassica napus]
MFSGRRWLLQHRHRRLGLLGIGVCATVRFVLSLWVKSIGVGVGLKLSRVFPVVLDEILRLFSMKLSVENLGDEDGYGVLLRRLPAKLVAFFIFSG